MAGPVHSICTGFKSSRDTAFLFFLSLWLYNATEHGRPHSSLLQVSRQRVELVLRLGLNSHSLHPEGFPSTAQFAFRLAGDPEHATIVSSAALCCRCLPSYSWYLSAFVAAGAEVGGRAPKSFGIMHAVKTSIASSHSGGEAS